MTWTRWHDRGHVPMRVVARMDEQIAYLGDLLHLDGFLHTAVFHDFDIATRKTIEPIETSEWPRDFVLPLSTWWVDYDVSEHGEIDGRLLKRRITGARAAGPQLWGWCASAAHEDKWGARGKVEIRKKPDLARMARYSDAKTAHLGAGHLKAYDLAVPTVLSLDVEWYAHGDPDRVRHLLQRHVPAIGKKRGIGLGRVRSWTVEPCADDRSVVDEHGVAARRLPVGAADGATRYGAIRPPYFAPGRVVMAVEPC